MKDVGEDEAKDENVSKFSPPLGASSGTSAKLKIESDNAQGIRRNKAGLRNRQDRL